MPRLHPVLSRLLTQASALRRRWSRDRRGAIAVFFAVSALTVVIAIGSGLDLANGYSARQHVSAIAALTCQYANRPEVVQLAFGSGGATAYATAVNTYEAAVFNNQSQTLSWSQTTATPFTYTPQGAGSVTLTATVPTTIMNVIGISSMSIGVTQQCFTVPAPASQQPVPDGSTPLLVNEGFENFPYAPSTKKNLAWYLPSGQVVPYGTQSGMTVHNTASANAAYVGLSGVEWIVMGYCLEVDVKGATVATAAEGTHSAELDCDNGSDTAGNSSISTKVYLNAGASYELRWDYAGRMLNTNYQTSYICGSTAGDTAWANDYAGYAASFSSNATNHARTNQINVYLDPDTAGLPPTHPTLDGTQTLAGSNLIDMCVYSCPPGNTNCTLTGNVPTYPNPPYGWIERSVPINVTTAGYYWLSFAADGANDSFGGQIDNIRLCQGTCPGTVADNFPSVWQRTSSTDPYVILFEDNFEAPTYYNGSGSKGKTYNGAYYNTGGNVDLSSWSSNAWGGTQGWANAPTNQIPYWTAGCPQSVQCVQLGYKIGSSSLNSLISMPFLLVPGYYQISYNYVSEVVSALTGTAYCDTATPPTPASAGLPVSSSGAGIDRVSGGASSPSTFNHDTNAVGVFLSHAQLASTPNPSATLGYATTYTNTTTTTAPDGTSQLIVLNTGTTPMLSANGTVAVNAVGTPVITNTTTTATAAPNTINLSSYTASATSALIDICGYAPTAQTRTVAVYIPKSAFYWLTFAALGTVDGFGGVIDDVIISAIGGQTTNMTTTPYITIPVPYPQPGTALTPTGGAFSFTADLH